ncbi:hypothetical protein [Microbacterium flavum]|uniref:Lipoprotein n=1 Tax=Microbacterium flavum TaxID=415216 RepID=A0ABS5XWI1_9MICO|nr:hypothetical protein [Microbacterium flavum]MBT8798897.1 hypothetical protein [Microbacterium flavum]
MTERRAPRRAAAILAAALIAIPLAACSASPPQDPAATTPAPTEGAQDMPLQSVYDAVGAADPRVDRVSTVKLSQSGPTEMMTVVVRIPGDEPVSTETLENVLRAARDAAPAGVGGIELLARRSENPDQLIDLGPAIEGLPEGVVYVWVDRGLTMLSDALAKL